MSVSLDVETLRGWIGRTETALDTVSERLVRELRVTLDEPAGAPAPGDEAPIAVHWCLARRPCRWRRSGRTAIRRAAASASGAAAAADVGRAAGWNFSTRSASATRSAAPRASTTWWSRRADGHAVLRHRRPRDRDAAAAVAVRGARTSVYRGADAPAGGTGTRGAPLPRRVWRA